MDFKKKIDIESIILALLEGKDDISLQEIAQEAGISARAPTDRRTIQRSLTKLLHNEVIQAQGQARARRYTLTKKTQSYPLSMEEGIVFHDVPLSERSRELLRYLSKPRHTRIPVGYHQDFLRTYEPNQTSYLNPSLREELFSVGNVEPIARPAGTYARTIFHRLLIDLSWNSSRLEGNTYSLLETQRLIELGENATSKDATDAQMILNHKDAIEYMVEGVHETTISMHEICSIHALLSNNLLGDPSASGRVRNIAVGISGTTYLPLENPHLLHEYFNLFIQKMNQIEDPFEQSFFSMVHLSYMQAFEDVNKRTARLVANIPLMKRNLKPLSFIDVLQQDYVMSLLGVYEKNDISLLRDLYVWAYGRSSQRYSALQQTMGEPNLLKMKYRGVIQDIVQTIILNKIPGSQVVSSIKCQIEALNLPTRDSTQLFQVIETEMMSLHDGNIARFKIRPSEFQEWKRLQ